MTFGLRNSVSQSLGLLVPFRRSFTPTTFIYTFETLTFNDLTLFFSFLVEILKAKLSSRFRRFFDTEAFQVCSSASPFSVFSMKNPAWHKNPNSSQNLRHIVLGQECQVTLLPGRLGLLVGVHVCGVEGLLGLTTLGCLQYLRMTGQQISTIAVALTLGHAPIVPASMILIVYFSLLLHIVSHMSFSLLVVSGNNAFSPFTATQCNICDAHAFYTSYL